MWFKVYSPPQFFGVCVCVCVCACARVVWRYFSFSSLWSWALGGGREEAEGVL